MKKLSPKRKVETANESVYETKQQIKSLLFTKEPGDLIRQAKYPIADIRDATNGNVKGLYLAIQEAIKILINTFSNKAIVTDIQKNYLSVLADQLEELKLSENAISMDYKINIPQIMHIFSVWLNTLYQSAKTLSKLLSSTEQPSEIKIKTLQDMLILREAAKPIYDAYWLAEKQQHKAKRNSSETLTSSTESSADTTDDISPSSSLEEDSVLPSPITTWKLTRTPSKDRLSSPRTLSGRVSPGAHRNMHQSRLYQPSKTEMEKYYSRNGAYSPEELRSKEASLKEVFKPVLQNASLAR